MCPCTCPRKAIATTRRIFERLSLVSSNTILPCHLCYTMSSSSQRVSMLPTPPSTQETPSSSKKRKTDDTNTLKENQKRAANAGLWFTDGNIIIVAQSTPFRVHQSVISQQSVVFRNLCRLAAMGACEFLDNVPLVRTTDNWRDFSDLLKAIYNSQEYVGWSFMCSRRFRGVGCI